MAKNKEQPVREDEQMSLEEARAYRASLYKPSERPLQEHEKKEAFRIFWASNRRQYGKGKNLESILWTHLKAVKLDEPSKFEEGLKHFGLKKVR